MRRFAVKALLTAAVIAGMVGAAGLFGSREIIFPEVAAILTGFVLAPRLPWRTTLPRAFAALVVCAVIGTLVSQFVPGPLWAKMTLAYTLAQGVLMASGTTLAPIISAAVLPVMLGSKGWIYPVSAAVLAAVCCLVRFGLARAAWVPPELVKPHRGVWGGEIDFLLRTAVVALIAAVATGSSALFLAAPPLLVSYTQMTRRRNPLGRQPMRVTGLVALCAVVGTLCRVLLSATRTPSTGLSCLAAGLAMLAVAVIFKKLHLFFPPAAALAILPFLLNGDQVWLYPVEVTLGQLVLASLAVLGTSLRTRKKEWKSPGGSSPR